MHQHKAITFAQFDLNYDNEHGFESIFPKKRTETRNIKPNRKLIE